MLFKSAPIPTNTTRAHRENLIASELHKALTAAQWPEPFDLYLLPKSVSLWIVYAITEGFEFEVPSYLTAKNWYQAAQDRKATRHLSEFRPWLQYLVFPVWKAGVLYWESKILVNGKPTKRRELLRRDIAYKAHLLNSGKKDPFTPRINPPENMLSWNGNEVYLDAFPRSLS